MPHFEGDRCLLDNDYRRQTGGKPQIDSMRPATHVCWKQRWFLIVHDRRVLKPGDLENMLGNSLKKPE